MIELTEAEVATRSTYGLYRIGIGCSCEEGFRTLASAIEACLEADTYSNVTSEITGEVLFQFRHGKCIYWYPQTEELWRIKDES